MDGESSIFDYLRTAFEELYTIETKLNQLYEEMAENCTETIMNKVSYYQDILQEKSFYGIDSTIQKVASGLGIVAMGMETNLKNLSGGEQAKVKLCKLCMTPCNVLILDEPTNHLDVETKEELKKTLLAFKGTVILVSHEASFYKDLATRIVSIENLCIKRL